VALVLAGRPPELVEVMLWFGWELNVMENFRENPEGLPSGRTLKHRYILWRVKTLF
jgi:hypothetical protein